MKNPRLYIENRVAAPKVIAKTFWGLAAGVVGCRMVSPPRDVDVCGCPCVRSFLPDGSEVVITDHDAWCGVQRRSEWRFDASGLRASNEVGALPKPSDADSGGLGVAG